MTNAILSFFNHLLPVPELSLLRAVVSVLLIYGAFIFGAISIALALTWGPRRSVAYWARVIRGWFRPPVVVHISREGLRLAQQQRAGKASDRVLCAAYDARHFSSPSNVLVFPNGRAR